MRHERSFDEVEDARRQTFEEPYYRGPWHRYLATTDSGRSPTLPRTSPTWPPAEVRDGAVAASAALQPEAHGTVQPVAHPLWTAAVRAAGLDR